MQSIAPATDTRAEHHMKAVLTDGREIKCYTITEKERGVCLYAKGNTQIGYIPDRALSVILPVDYDTDGSE